MTTFELQKDPAQPMTRIDALTRRLAQDIGERVKATLVQLGTLHQRAVVSVIPYPDRAVCVIDASGVLNINKIYTDNTRHQLKTALKGRKVVLTNTRGVFVQVAWQPEPFIELTAAPLDFSKQPSPLHLPIGITRRGPHWQSIEELDSVLIGGSRRMGKTMILHSWIQALQQGGAVELVLFDGKANIEFGDYARPDTVAAEDLHEALRNVQREVAQREKLFRAAHARNLREYNARAAAKLKPIVIIIDEVADVLDKHPQAEPILNELVARCGAFGVHPIFATQRPDADTLSGVARTNLGTRIALPVPDAGSSRTILAQTGAEKLPARPYAPNRMLMRWSARCIELQAFQIATTQTAPTTQARSAAAQTGGQAPAQHGLSEDECALVEIALSQLDGTFPIREIYQLGRYAGVHYSKDRINDLARQWELRGWLSKVERDPKSGVPRARKVLPDLIAQAGLGGLADQRNRPIQADLGVLFGSLNPGQVTAGGARAAR
jgi:hypothetical protein